MAANYSMSSAPGQACVWRDRPHFRKGWRRKRRRGGAGKERRMLIQPPHHVKCPNSPAGTPSFCQMKMVLKPLFVQMEDRWVGLGNGIHHSAGTEPWEGLWICCSGYCRDGRPHKQVACACKEPYEGSVVSRSLIFSIMVAEVLVCQGISHTKWVNILV